MNQNYKIAIRKYGDVEIIPNTTWKGTEKSTLIEIDKFTSEYLDSSDLLKRAFNINDPEFDIYIIKQGVNKTSFRDIIYKKTSIPLSHFIDAVDEKGKINISDSYLNSYVGNLIYHLKQDVGFRNYMIKIFPYLKGYIEASVENTMLLSSTKYQSFLNKISNYNTIRKIIMCEKIYNNEIPNLYQVRSKIFSPYKKETVTGNISIPNRIEYKEKISNDDLDDDLAFLSEEEIKMMTGEDNDLHKSFR